MIDLTLDKTKDAFRVADTLKLVLAQRLLPKYEKFPNLRDYINSEVEWLKENGALNAASISETSSNNKIGVVTLIEAIKVDHAIKKVIRAPILDTEEVYKLGADQLQYETLIQAGIRQVESGHSKVIDCLQTLDSNLSAGVVESRRARLCREYGMTYQAVSSAIDEFYLMKEQNVPRDLLEILQERGANHVAS
jgi:hypothetical protein